jgi:heme o synthase
MGYTPINRRFLALVLTTAVFTFFLMVAGNAVRVMNASAACPDWPTCYGAWTPPPGVDLGEPVGIQYAHRALAILSALLTAGAAGWGLVLFRRERSSRRFALIASSLAVSAGLMLVESLLGSGLVRQGESAVLSGLHMAAALVSFGLTTSALVGLFFQQSPRLSSLSPFSRLAWIALGGLFILLISGTLVSATGAGQACAGWPFCAGGLPTSGLGWLAFLHRFIVLVAGGVLTYQFISAWRAQRSQAVLLSAATAAFLLMLGQVLVGAVIASRGFPADLVGLHASAAAGMWAAQVILAISTLFTARSAADEAAEATEPLPILRRVKDFVILSKPIIVLLLLVTTYAGMVVGGKSIPSLPLTVWTLIGGALAAGGSSALNQFIDRDTDKAMQRTSNRPLPDGRLKPAEGLAYGLGACLVSFFLLAVTVNLLSAVLSLAGMVYYVLIYSIWLKRLTVQNIVIGGGAGATPPLVGWAAATGALNTPSLFLFAIIFLWTPPHFWALAIVRRKDYARGNIPMLPVIYGEMVTRKQILIYTIELVALTLLMPVLHIAGTVYLISALILGLWLVYTAWQVYRSGGNKLAWKMYRYSSMYLAFLMLALVIDVLI